VVALITVLGISVEGSVIAERQDANAPAYHSDVSVKSLLSGAVPRPDWAQPLYQTLDACTKFRGGQREWIDDSPAQEQEYAFTGLSTPGGEQQPRTLQKKKKSGPPPFPPSNWGEQKSGGSYFNDPGNTSTTAGSLGPHGTSPIKIPNTPLLRLRRNSNRISTRKMIDSGKLTIADSALPTPKSQGSFGTNKVACMPPMMTHLARISPGRTPTAPRTRRTIDRETSSRGLPCRSRTLIQRNLEESVR
jgi:hypothetical protein